MLVLVHFLPNYGCFRSNTENVGRRWQESTTVNVESEDLRRDDLNIKPKRKLQWIILVIDASLHHLWELMCKMGRTFSNLPRDEGNADLYCNEIPFYTHLLKILRSLTILSVERVWSTESLVNGWWKCKAMLESSLPSIQVEYYNPVIPVLDITLGGICKSVHGNIVVIEKKSRSNPNVHWQENG